ncbi:MAG: hypothetical protein VW270_04555 [Candidatus Poseidoniales archaeon]
MAATPKRLDVSELDFDEIKDNLKVFLKGQTEFTDYDFEGSGMNILLDTLAYNTHYLAFNANMLANEMFLDSSALRSSVTSHAKTLGYVPQSARAATATVEVSLNTTNASATMDAGTVFNTTIDGTAFTFINATDVTATNIGNAIVFSDITLYEGTYVTSRYTVDTQDVEQRFLINDNRVDTRTLTVKVQNSSSDSTTTAYTEATDIAAVTSTSNVYFLQEVEVGKFEVYFGDGVLGKGLSDDNIVILQYVVSNKTEGNGATTFTSAGAIDTVTNVGVTTISSSAGGSEPESIESIKLNAPLDYSSQGRAVTSEDYKTLVRQLYANTQAVAVFGGETGSFDTSLGVVSTPEYGKVFISIKSTTGENLTETQKEQLKTDLQPFTVASITPVIVDPETMFLILTSNVNYDSNATTKGNATIESNVRTTITNYNTDNLNTFNGLFRHSKLVGLIDSTDTSITSNTLSVSLAKFFTPDTTQAKSYNLYYNNKFFNPHAEHNKDSGGIVASTGFGISGQTGLEFFFDDDGAGNLRIYRLVAGVRTYFNSTAGTVDYANGTISINSVSINSVSNVDGAVATQIRVTATPDSLDVIPKRNQLLEIDLVNTTITASVDNVAVGNDSGQVSQTTTSSVSSTSGY